LEEQFSTYKSPLELCQLRFERFRNNLNYFIIEEVDRIMQIENKTERIERLNILTRAVDEYLKIYPWSIEVPQIQDPYDYSSKIKLILLNSMGILPV
jgi:hypothetical protein